MSTLSVTVTAQNAWNVIRFNFQTIVRLGMILLAIMILGEVLGAFGENAVAGSQSMAFAGVLGLLGLVLLIGTIAAYIPFSVNVHLFTLAVGAGRAPEDLPMFRWRKIEWLYLLWAVILGVAFGVVFMIVAFIVGGIFGFGLAASGSFGAGAILTAAVIFLLLVPLYYLASRFSFMFVEIAQGMKPDIGASWRQTAPGHIKIFLTYLLISLPFLGATIVLALIVGFVPVLVMQILVGILAAFINFIWTACLLSGMALCYQHEVPAA